ncbi:hypothetical protein, partial [Pseudomonas aeruginosa]|uniref:hypothetical protein n=1 Tax=Pseudomonas aeruginosa TaxID=287 RepID=UPI003968BEA6
PALPDRPRPHFLSCLYGSLVDLLAFQVPSVAAITVGKILGGTDNHNVPLHYNKESGEGLYS